MLKTKIPAILLQAYRLEVRRLTILAKVVDAANPQEAAEYRRRAGTLKVVIDGYERLNDNVSPK